MTDAPRAFFATTASEREILESFLDLHRGVAVVKASGLDLAAAAGRLVPSETTLAGMLRHLAVTEREWFWQTVGGEPPLPGEAEEDPDTTWELGADASVAGLIAEYEATCRRSSVILGEHDLEEIVRHRRLGPVSVRWIVVHMIEETARHVGQADILRELTDGATGVL